MVTVLHCAIVAQMLAIDQILLSTVDYDAFQIIKLNRIAIFLVGIELPMIANREPIDLFGVDQTIKQPQLGIPIPDLPQLLSQLTQRRVGQPISARLKFLPIRCRQSQLPFVFNVGRLKIMPFCKIKGHFLEKDVELWTF